MPIAYHNGELMPEDEVRISPRDRGLLFGDSVFETMPVYNGRVFLLDRHIARLFDSARMIHLRPPLESEALAANVKATIEANDMLSGSARLTVTRGTGPGGIDPFAGTTPTVLITVAPLRNLSPLREQGVALVLADAVRNDPRAVVCAAKTGNMLNSVLARASASRAGAFEALMLNADSTVAEGSISNVFAVTEGVVYTPPADGRILPGVTRGAVLEIARELGLATAEEPFHIERLDAATEIWLTNSLIEILPVCTWQGRALPTPWPIWRRVADAYQEWVARVCPPTDRTRAHPS